MSIRAFAGIQPRIDASAWVDESAQVIGDVVLEADVSIWPLAVIRGDINSIRVGARSNIQDGCVLHVTHAGPWSDGGAPLVVGTDLTLGHQAVLHGCSVGNFCLIGIGAIVLDRAVIGDYVMVGAGSLVPGGKQLESGHLYMGAPVKKIRSLTEPERRMLEYSSGHYVQLKDRYRSGK
ncbi:MAG: gamma carbonic anhydrase family protein [Gammaproteobacteria bacterium RIFCSPLOWO2_02_FULL_61_13]|nr:MAG: gamma carbonic anhydrase family protein [Gammaproteobacteria bacterium RIFCSPLOWO2_02_FULL_61_13]